MQISSKIIIEMFRFDLLKVKTQTGWLLCDSALHCHSDFGVIFNWICFEVIK